MGKKKKELSFTEKVRKLKNAGLFDSPPIREANPGDQMEDLGERVKKILGLLNNFKLKPGRMIYFIMYDIENHKVRYQIAKYLLKKGCTRVQKSIFLAHSERVVFDQIKDDLHEVQACYENNDSIFLVPIATDQIKAMKVIGKSIDFDLILHNRNTLFF